MSSDSNNAHLRLPASVTMDGIESLFAHLRQIKLHESEIFTVDASQVTCITTPGIQLLLSLARSLKERNAKLSLLHPTENFSEAFKALGLGATLTAWSVQ